MIFTPKSPARAFTLIELLTVIAIIGILAAIIIPVVGRVRSSARGAENVSKLREIGTAFSLHANDNKDAYPVAYDGALGQVWVSKLAPYLAGSNWTITQAQPFFIAPTSVYEFTLNPGFLDTTYGMNKALGDEVGTSKLGLRRSKITNPSHTVVAADAAQRAPGQAAYADFSTIYFETLGSTTPTRAITVPAANAAGEYPAGGLSYRDNGKAAAVFADGHVERLAKGAFQHRHFSVN